MFGALGHVGIDQVYYNGFTASEMRPDQSLVHLGVENIPPMVTRGILLDMTDYFGIDPLPLGQQIDEWDIMGAAIAQGVWISSGDVVLLHTGWLDLSYDPATKAQFLSGEPGITVGAAEYLAGRGVVAVGADTWAVEVLPSEPDAGIFPVHQTLLAKNGVYILENIVTRELAEDHAYRFMFVLGQPKLVGGVQAIVHPVAIR